MMNVSLFGGNGFDEFDELAKAATSAFGKSFPSIPKLTDRIDFPLDKMFPSIGLMAANS